MKLKKLKSDATTTLELVNPATDEPMGVFLHGITPDSKEYKELEKSMVKKKTTELLLKKNKDAAITIDPEDAEIRRAIIVKTVRQITDDEEGKYTDEDIEMFMTSPEHTYVYEQWVAHLDDRKNFFGKPATPQKSGSKS